MFSDKITHLQDKIVDVLKKLREIKEESALLSEKALRKAEETGNPDTLEMYEVQGLVLAKFKLRADGAINVLTN